MRATDRDMRWNNNDTEEDEEWGGGGVTVMGANNWEQFKDITRPFQHVT